VSADGAHVERVTNTPREDEHAGWSPDGNAIVYDSTARGGRSEAFIVRRARPGAPWGTPWQLTKNGSTDPKWSPDDLLIAFCVEGQLRVISPDGSGERTLVDAHAGNLPEPQYPMWSSDSRTIFYKAYDRARHSTIWSVPAAGGTPRLMVTFDDPARRSMRREFAMDGRRFYFTVARDESDLSAVELELK
jgi:Tol biopolymer transport system component